MKPRHVGPRGLEQGILRRARQGQTGGHVKDVGEPDVVDAGPARLEDLIDDQSA